GQEVVLTERGRRIAGDGRARTRVERTCDQIARALRERLARRERLLVARDRGAEVVGEIGVVGAPRELRVLEPLLPAPPGGALRVQPLLLRQEPSEQALRLLTKRLTLLRRERGLGRRRCGRLRRRRHGRLPLGGGVLDPTRQQEEHADERGSGREPEAGRDQAGTATAG